MKLNLKQIERLALKKLETIAVIASEVKANESGKIDWNNVNRQARGLSAATVAILEILKK